MPSTYKSTCPPGTIVDYSASGIANGNFLPCDGTALTEIAYPDLFAAIGATWGSPGAGQFNVPDSLGRSSIAAGSGGSLTTRSTGQSGGEENHQLSVSEMAAHNHGGGNHDHGTNMDAVLSGSLGGSSVRANGIDDGSVVINFSGTIITTQGSNAAHNNMQPFVVFTKMIKV